MRTLLLIALGGAVGAVLRAVLATVPQRFLPGGFPHGTLLVNLLGSFAIGVLWQLSQHAAIDKTAQAVLITGLLGAFTTFSTFSLDNLMLLQQGETSQALLNIAVSVGLGLIAVYAGTLTAGA